ncbi:MAG TPA: MOSC N-terminal beta barrel domain-containing protein [Myxococcaceae bacterium]|nr:MOSC N-terminal beta barrel domain-containing protein [Myxococcaceae bacterium]
MTSLSVRELNVYPVKSCRGIPLGSARLDRWGIEHDRSWMVVDGGDQFISQRTQPRLALVEPALGADRLTLRAPGMEPLELPPTGRAGTEREVVVWDDRCRALDQGELAADWFSRYLGVTARLVRIGSAFERAVDPTYFPEGAEVGFADAYPLLVLSDASLAELNARLPEPLPMNRFRPNLVVTGCGPFAEDGWKRVRVGEVTLRIVKPCKRCVTTTVDQGTAEQGKEPLATLATFRRDGDGVLFGQNAVHQGPGRIRVGDAVQVLG